MIKNVLFLQGPAHLVYYITLNLNISASGQNIKNLIGNFGAIHVGYYACQISGVLLYWCGRRMR